MFASDERKKMKKRVYDMTDRELREYKRMLRRKKVFNFMIMKCVAGLLVVFALTFCLTSLIGRAGDDENNMKFKYYTKVEVERGDSLWKLADQYMDTSEYSSKQDFIYEVAHINHLDEDCNILNGQILIVPYFSTEFVK